MFSPIAIMLALILSVAPFNKTYSQEAVNAYQIVEGSSQLAEWLFQDFKTKNGNFAFSPINIYTLLTISYYGSKGTTAADIKNILHFPESGFIAQQQLAAWDKSLGKISNLHRESSFWIGSSLKINEDFKDTVTLNFGPILHGVDFNTHLDFVRGQINRWASSGSKGKINSLLQPYEVNFATKLILASYLYIEGAWQLPFPASKTENKPFNVNNFVTRSVPMMSQTGQIPFVESDLFSAIELPFGNLDKNKTDQSMQFSLICVLPKATGSLAFMGDEVRFQKILQAVRSAKVSLVSVSLPRFRIAERQELSEPLESIGLNIAFSNRADFSGMIDPSTPINKILDASYFSVNEYGIETTANPLPNSNAFPEAEAPLIFNANQPFLFFIIEKESQAILLMGRISEP